MATEVGGIRVRIVGDDSDLQKKLRASVNQLGKYAASAAAAGAAVATALTVQGLKAVDSQAKLARSLDASINSLKAMQLAASDAGLDGLEGSLARLNRRLGAAEMGMGDAAVSVKSLGLNLQELSGMAVDERMATIADAIRDSGMSMQEAARHAQNLGFEQAEAASFFRQGGDAIRSYRREIDELGLGLTELDAAKVEAANDAFSRVGMQLDVVRQQLAIEVAPILESVSDQFVQMTKDAGGLGPMITDAFSQGIKIAAYMADAMHGVKTAVTVAVNTIDIGLNALLLESTSTLRKIIELGAELPGSVGDKFREVNLASQNFAAVAQSSIEEAKEAIHAALEEPLPGEAMKQFASDAQAAAQKAAQAFVEAQEKRDESEGGGGIQLDDATKEKLDKRLQQIREANMTEVELLNNKFSAENDAINTALEGQLITEGEWQQMMRDQKARHEGELTDIEERQSEERKRLAEQEARVKQQALSDALSGMTKLMNTDSRKLFEIGKAAAYSQAVIDGKAAIVGAYKVGASIGGPPLGAAYATAAGLATAANIMAIKNQSFGGSGGGGGSAGGGMSATQQVSGNQQPVQPAQQVQISGLDPDSIFKGSQFIDAANKAQEEGYQLVF